MQGTALRSYRAPARLLRLLLLLIGLAGCTELAYQSMNDPARDAWQRPEAVIQALNLTPGMRVADLGAGGGYFTFRLADAVGPEGKVYAVDVEEASLRFIENEAKRRGGVSHVELVRAAPNDPHLPPNGVDLIFTCNTYHHLRDRITYFKSLARYLRPKGRIAIIEYKEGGWLGSLFGHATTKESARREMEAAGYRLINDFDFLPKQHFQLFSLDKP